MAVKRTKKGKKVHSRVLVERERERRGDKKSQQQNKESNRSKREALLLLFKTRSKSTTQAQHSTKLLKLGYVT